MILIVAINMGGGPIVFVDMYSYTNQYHNATTCHCLLQAHKL